MGRSLKDTSGVALILTILIVGLVVAVTLLFNTSMRSELHGAANLKDGIKLNAIARSGFNYALAVLIEDGAAENGFDALNEVWADSEALSAPSISMFEEGRFQVQILDQSGRIQVNKLVNEKGEFYTKQKELLTRFLKSEEFGLDEEQVKVIVDSIKDWIDPDDEAMDLGAESAYYEALPRPYSCRNAPLESLEELLLIRGITKELFYGTGETPGIAGYLSVLGNEGDGKININTAPPLVLRSLSDRLDDDRVQNMVKYREDEENDLKDPKWYKNVLGMGDIILDDELITSVSTTFEIHSKGLLGAMSKQVTAVVGRQEGTIKILSWKIE